ncbi:unnamed protein product [Meloidogyne enterolobii]|uniref:Uncharacterized protein n=1 Tax=Meloidogyne enterolobii TaxID=390850 RepID=A0ACB1AFZ0_MELEN
MLLANTVIYKDIELDQTFNKIQRIKLSIVQPLNNINKGYDWSKSFLQHFNLITQMEKYQAFYENNLEIIKNKRGDLINKKTELVKNDAKLQKMNNDLNESIADQENLEKKFEEIKSAYWADDNKHFEELCRELEIDLEENDEEMEDEEDNYDEIFMEKSEEEMVREEKGELSERGESSEKGGVSERGETFERGESSGRGESSEKGETLLPKDNF